MSLWLPLLPGLLAMLAVPGTALLGPMPCSSQVANLLQMLARFWGGVVGSMGPAMLSNAEALEVVWVVVEWIAVPVVDLTSPGDRTMQGLPDFPVQEQG